MPCSLLAGCGSKTNDDSNTPSDGWAPKGAVTVICPYGAGGGQDICARIFAKYAEKYCGVSFVIDNITGGYTFINALDASSVHLFVDVSGLEEGVYTLPVQIHIDNAPEFTCALSSPQVTVTLQAKP